MHTPATCDSLVGTSSLSATRMSPSAVYAHSCILIFLFASLHIMSGLQSQTVLLLPGTQQTTKLRLVYRCHVPPHVYARRHISKLNGQQRDQSTTDHGCGVPYNRCRSSQKTVQPLRFTYVCCVCRVLSRFNRRKRYYVCRNCGDHGKTRTGELH
jgi:hypothetical protein